MSGDVVKRLRDATGESWHHIDLGDDWQTMRDAADELERARGLLAEARAVMRYGATFAEEADLLERISTTLGLETHGGPRVLPPYPKRRT